MTITKEILFQELRELKDTLEQDKNRLEVINSDIKYSDLKIKLIEDLIKLEDGK